MSVFKCQAVKLLQKGLAAECQAWDFNDVLALTFPGF